MAYTNKTQKTKINPLDYLKKNYPPDESKQKKIYQEALALIRFYKKISGAPCVLWNKMFGFGTYYYADSTGAEHEYFVIGFSITKNGFTLYNMRGWEMYRDMLAGSRVKQTGKSCLLIKSITDIDLDKLERVYKLCIKDMRTKYKTDI
jgi:hypothetical protein